MNEDWTKDIQRLMADRKVKAPDGLQIGRAHV